MSRKFYDLLTLSEECVEFGKELGYAKACLQETNFSRKPANGKVNIVPAGDLETNRSAVRNSLTHVLLDPSEPKSFDISVANVAQQNGIYVGISLAGILERHGAARIRHLRNMMFVITLCKKAGVGFVIVSGSRNRYGMRTPMDLASIGELLGLTQAQSLWAVSQAPEAILKKEGLL